MSETNKTASTFLGKKTAGSVLYNPDLLVAVPREENRRAYDIDSANLPFAGYDIWHCYEFSALSENGIPITKLLKIKYSCDNPYIIESKSLKLYLNSFNMSRFGKNADECLEICRQMIEKDLSVKLETTVQAYFLDNNTKRGYIFKEFKNIMSFVDEKILQINEFKENPKLLEYEKTDIKKEYFLTFDSLRSNCRVTHQPDFGDVFIYYKSDKHIKETGLVKYLCSFRCENHFHEECCEMIYKRLFDILNSDELFVCALYTRRGGIDISPVRYGKNSTFKGAEDLCDIKKFVRYGIKQ